MVVKILTDKKSNNSLFLYTALIFIAAIVIVVISFFSQINLEKKHNEYMGEQSANSITEKTAQLSDENMVLLETTKNLNEQNSQLLQDNKDLTDRNTALENNNRSSEQLYKIFNLINIKDFDSARQELETLDSSSFSGEKLTFYEFLKKQLTDN